MERLTFLIIVISWIIKKISLFISFVVHLHGSAFNQYFLEKLDPQDFYKIRSNFGGRMLSMPVTEKLSKSLTMRVVYKVVCSLVSERETLIHVDL